MAIETHMPRIQRIWHVARPFLFVCLVTFCVCGSALPQKQKPIGKENLLRALRIGGVRSKEYVKLIEEHGVDFQITASDEQDIRREGKYLGRKALDNLVAAVRNSYRRDASLPPTVSPPSSSSPDLPLAFLNEIPLRGGSPQRLDTLMTAAGYTGPTEMAVLIVISNEANDSEVIVGTRSDLNAKNGARLLGGTDYFNFPGGENSTRVFILSAKDGKIDITYRPRSVSATKPNWDQIDGWVRSSYPAGTVIDHVEIVDDPQCRDGCQKCIVVLRDSSNNTRNESVTVTYQFANGRWEWKAKKENGKQ